MMKLLGLHHIAIIGSDYARSKDFYHHVLGLPIISETWREERQSWKLNLALPDGSQIELFSFPAPPSRPSRPEACGLRHLALAVEDLEGVRGSLSASGIALEEIRIDELTGLRFCFLADPDGLPIELYECHRRADMT